MLRGVHRLSWIEGNTSTLGALLSRLGRSTIEALGTRDLLCSDSTKRRQLSCRHWEGLRAVIAVG